MRNLKLLEKRIVKNINGISDALFLAFDADIGVVYIATWSQLIAFSPDTQQNIAAVSIREDATAEDCVPVGLQYICDQQAVCVAIADGRLCVWNTLDPQKLECVGEVDGGLTAMSWSPDLEVIVITTGHGKLLLMTREFDVITEVPMYSNSKGEVMAQQWPKFRVYTEGLQRYLPFAQDYSWQRFELKKDASILGSLIGIKKSSTTADIIQ